MARRHCKSSLHERIMLRKPIDPRVWVGVIRVHPHDAAEDTSDEDAYTFLDWSNTIHIQ